MTVTAINAAPPRANRVAPTVTATTWRCSIAWLLYAYPASSTQPPPNPVTEWRAEANERQRHQREPLEPENAQRQLRVPDVPGRVSQPARHRLQGGKDRAALPPERDRRPPRDAEEAGRLDAARQRRRAEAGGTGDRRSVGPLRAKSCGRLVRPEEGASRQVRHVHAAAPGRARPGRGRAQPEEQPDAGTLNATADR